MNDNTSIQIFKDYPDNKYIPLVPVQTLTQISPLHKISVNVVQISADKDEKDTYREGNGEYALTKKALMKLMATANIQIVDSKSVVPSSCQRCLEMAKATGKPCPCGPCECKNDVAWQVTIAVPDLSGGYRRVTATREFICADERGKMKTEGQYNQAFAFRSAHTESKALNRALREALMIKSTYKPHELEKPFAVAVISPNFDDKELKSAMISRFAAGENALFGEVKEISSGNSVGVKAISAPKEEIVISAQEPEPEDNIPFPGEEDMFSQEPIIECHDCGAMLEAFTDPKGNEWTVERISAFSTERFGKPLCVKCMRELARQSKGGGAR